MMRALIVFICFVHGTFALNLELTHGVNAAFPIGINALIGEPENSKISQVIRDDLHLSGQFRLVAPPHPAIESDAPLRAWRHAGADSVLSGTVTLLDNNRYEVHFQLFDVTAHGHLLLTKTYQVNEHELRALAHHISDEIYQTLTGEHGVFSTKIAYVLVKKQKNIRKFSLEVADMDGHNPQSLLVSHEPIMSPSWSPDGKQISYVSFENKRAQIYTIAVNTGKRRLITSFPGINGAPAWSPDRQYLAVVLSKGGAPNIYQIRLSNGKMQQLTFGKAINTEPHYSPDGKYLLFTSGRGGAPQIYRLELQTGAIKRMTYEGSYNAHASYTPNQTQIVMQHRDNDQFSIGVQDAKTGKITVLTDSESDESPSLSPNGRLIVYATEYKHQGILAIVGTGGDVHIRLPSNTGNVQEPAWSPYLS